MSQKSGRTDPSPLFSASSRAGTSFPDTESVTGVEPPTTSFTNGIIRRAHGYVGGTVAISFRSSTKAIRGSFAYGESS